MIFKKSNKQEIQFVSLVILTLFEQLEEHQIQNVEQLLIDKGILPYNNYVNELLEKTKTTYRNQVK